MAAGKGTKVITKKKIILARSPIQSPRVQSKSPPISSPPISPTVNGKKKRKKKGKGKSVDETTTTSSSSNPATSAHPTSIAHLGMYDLDAEEDQEEDEDDDTIPPLEPLPPRTSSYTQTGLSPTLESVHFSTTASLAAASTANARSPAAHSELMATANDLYRNMGMMHGPGGEGGITMTATAARGGGAGGGAGAGGFRVGGAGVISADDEEYWAAFPPHIKNFVRSVWAQAPFESPGDERAKAQAMYAIAQQMVQSGKTSASATTTMATNGKGVTTTTTTVPDGVSLPFDPSMFSDPAFTLSLEQAAAAFGAPPAPLGTTTKTTNVVIEQQGYYSDEEEDGEDLLADEDNGQPATARLTQAELILSYQQALRQQKQHFQRHHNSNLATSIKRPSHPPPQPPPPAEPSPIGAELPKRMPGPTPSAPARLIRKPSAPDQSSDIHLNKQMPTAAAAAAVVGLKSQPQPPAPPPLPAAAPPSSRAAGKQPMAYAQSPQGQQQPQNTAAPGGQRPTSARAASKAPLPPHAYPHNHPHHHPSPPSSNASAPHKPRPPATGNTNPSTQPAPPKQPNKIWSTSTTEERERIKEFWLGLGEEERRNLVKIEKDTVLRKMKEQQKHSCSCAVCGRKRFVISPSSIGKKKNLTDRFFGYQFFLSEKKINLACARDFIAVIASMLGSMLLGMRLKKSSRYCTMLITRS